MPVLPYRFTVNIGPFYITGGGQAGLTKPASAKETGGGNKGPIGFNGGPQGASPSTSPQRPAAKSSDEAASAKEEGGEE